MTNGTSPCVLIVNLGSPSSLEIRDIKKYLKEFLSDDDVIELEASLRKQLDWELPIFRISALNKNGCATLVSALMDRIEKHRFQLRDSEKYRNQQSENEKLLAFEIRKKIENSKLAKANVSDMFE